jgi:hypothetical protein
MRAQSLIETASSVETNRRITELHLWAVHEGLRGAPPLWRAFAGMRTLHPQWAGYTYTWWRDRNGVNPGRRQRGEVMP